MMGDASRRSERRKRRILPPDLGLSRLVVDTPSFWIGHRGAPVHVFVVSVWELRRIFIYI
jgi:hypothetical protein